MFQLRRALIKSNNQPNRSQSKRSANSKNKPLLPAGFNFCTPSIQRSTSCVWDAPVITANARVENTSWPNSWRCLSAHSSVLFTERLHRFEAAVQAICRADCCKQVHCFHTYPKRRNHSLHRLPSERRRSNPGIWRVLQNRISRAKSTSGNSNDNWRTTMCLQKSVLEDQRQSLHLRRLPVLWNGRWDSVDQGR